MNDVNYATFEGAGVLMSPNQLTLWRFLQNLFEKKIQITFSIMDRMTLHMTIVLVSKVILLLQWREVLFQNNSNGKLCTMKSATAKKQANLRATETIPTNFYNLWTPLVSYFCRVYAVELNKGEVGKVKLNWCYIIMSSSMLLKLHVLSR
jgi:hypothetical protein